MKAYGETFGDIPTRAERKWSGRSSRGENSPNGRISLGEWKRIKRQPKKRERQHARRDIEQEFDIWTPTTKEEG